MSSSTPEISPYYLESGGGLGLPGAVNVQGLYNDVVEIFSWRGINAVLPAKGTNAEKALLAGIDGEARAGEYLDSDHSLGCRGLFVTSW